MIQTSYTIILTISLYTYFDKKRINTNHKRYYKMPLTFYSSTHDLKNTNPYFYITSILLSLLLYCFFQNIATLL